MLALEGIDRNLSFMVVEVGKQLDNMLQVMHQPTQALVRKIHSSDNYIDTLKSYIEKKAISCFRNIQPMDRQTADRIRAISTVSANLERIADFCADIAAQMGQLSDSAIVQRYNFGAYHELVAGAVRQVPEALKDNNAALAVEICRVEARTDELYGGHVKQIKEELRKGEQTDDLVTCLFIAHYLERMGDALQNIGEALLYAVTGEKLKFHEHVALHDTLGAGADARVRDVHVEFAYETRSGSRIGKVKDRRAADSELEAIFKKGHRDKLDKERQNIEIWERLMPGLPPRILEYREGNGDAALLLEFLDGVTFNEVVLNSEPKVIERTEQQVCQTLLTAWQRTLKREPVNGEFLGQLSQRLRDVWRVHPNFRRSGRRLGGLKLGSFDEMIDQAAANARDLAAPFSVLIHGDLNTDNIIVNHPTGQIHFIDLYRSRQMDYVQDVSVFLVSNFRMPVFERELRERIQQVMLSFFAFARDFAREQHDDTFEARLALGLVRSFMTSTRFELDESFAKTMFLRSTYLLEKFIAHGDRPFSQFRLTEEALIY